MSDTEVTPGSPEETIADEVDRLNREFWAATLGHTGCVQDGALIILLGGLMAVARGDTYAAPMALQTLREAVERVKSNEG